MDREGGDSPMMGMRSLNDNGANEVIPRYVKSFNI